MEDLNGDFKPKVFLTGDHKVPLPLRYRQEYEKRGWLEWTFNDEEDHYLYNLTSRGRVFWNHKLQQEDDLKFVTFDYLMYYLGDTEFAEERGNELIHEVARFMYNEFGVNLYDTMLRYKEDGKELPSDVVDWEDTDHARERLEFLSEVLQKGAELE